ncbi:MAG: RNA 3'-terminal phosphate cyclase [Asgard group archaeon]|nr:RNA 3'-terminal phosphate cyclase [Asgard group archaeon]
MILLKNQKKKAILSGFSLTEMVTIDGSVLEGGGSIVRNSVALAAVYQKPIEIINIRAKRSKPGLRNQHMFVIKAIGKMCNAELKGAYVGSDYIKFIPGKIIGGEFKVDVQTAGSLTLLLQALIPVAIHAPNPVKLLLKGGADVPMAPPYDYLKHVYKPTLEKLGLDITLCLGRRGHYPKGGGTISCDIAPIIRMKPINFKFEDVMKINYISGNAYAVQLPEHIPERMINTAINELKARQYKISSIEKEWYEPKYDPHIGKGTGITLWAYTNHGTIIAGDGLGKVGIPAEKVAETAVNNLIEQLNSGRPIDFHLADQLIIWMGLSQFPSIVDTTKITLHTLTNIHIIEKLSNAKFTVEGSEGIPGIITCDPS